MRKRWPTTKVEAINAGSELYYTSSLCDSDHYSVMSVTSGKCLLCEGVYSTTNKAWTSDRHSTLAKELGFIFTGVTCKKGHLTPHTLKGSCYACIAIDSAERYAKGASERLAKKKNRLKATRSIERFSDEQLTVIFGLLVGDGSITRPGTNSKGYDRGMSLNIAHSNKQHQYAVYKAKLLSDTFDKKITPSQTYNTARGKKYYVTRLSHYNGGYHAIYKMLYPNTIKTLSRDILNILDAKGIAHWYMDDGCDASTCTNDGSYKTLSFEIATYFDSYDEAEIVAIYFKERWQIDLKVFTSKRKYCIKSDGHKNALLFFELVAPYIVDCMKYKLHSYTYYKTNQHEQCNLICDGCKRTFARYANKSKKLCSQCTVRINRAKKSKATNNCTH